MGWPLLRRCIEYRRQILRAIQRDADAYSNAYSYSYSYVYANSYSYSDRDGNGNGNAAAYANTEAASHSGTAPVTFIRFNSG
jgi:hypothetical protein